MSKEQLNGADVGALLQEVHGEGVPHGMRGDRFANFANTVGFLALALHRGSGDVLVWPIARKEPVLRSFRSPPGTQDLQELRREHYVTVFLSLALFDPQDHALAVDGGRRKRDSFRDAQAGSVASGQNGTMLPARNAGKKLNDFLGTEDHG